MMDYEKLIRRLRNDADAYRNGKTLGRAFADQEDVLDNAATALSTLQAENEKLRAELEQAGAEITRLKHYEDKCHDCPIVCAKTEIIKAHEELEAVQAELEQVKRELQAYKDTGLEPEDFKRAFHEDAVLKLAGQALGIAPDRLRELAQADKEGRCVVLPAKPDQIIYQWRKGDDCPSVSRLDGVQINADGEITYPIWNGYLIPEDFGKTVFLTREEAALRREQDG